MMDGVRRGSLLVLGVTKLFCMRCVGSGTIQSVPATIIFCIRNSGMTTGGISFPLMSRWQVPPLAEPQGRARRQGGHGTCTLK